MLSILRKKYGIPKSMDDYKPLLLPYGKPYDELTRDEAAENFQWYKNNYIQRSEYIRDFVIRELGLKEEDLNYSFGDIKIIQQFVNKVCTTRKPRRSSLFAAEVLFASKGAGEKEAKEAARLLIPKELTTFSWYICNDLGMYINRIFLENNDSLRLDYTEKNNLVELFGFFWTWSYNSLYDEVLRDRLNIDDDTPQLTHCTFEPAGFINMHILEGKEDLLYRKCDEWRKRISKDGTPNENDELTAITNRLVEWAPTKLTVEKAMDMYKEIAHQFLLDKFYYLKTDKGIMRDFRKNLKASFKGTLKREKMQEIETLFENIQKDLEKIEEEIRRNTPIRINE